MSYLAKILPYIPAELEDSLNRTGCNWAIPQGLKYKSYKSVMYVSGDFEDVFARVVFYRESFHCRVFGDGHYIDMSVEDAMYLLALGNTIRLNDEMGFDSPELYRKFKDGVKDVVGRLEKRRHITEVWELFGVDWVHYLCKWGKGPYAELLRKKLA